MNLAELVARHEQTLQDAVHANSARTFHAHWPEAPSGKIYGETANADGEAAFKNQLDSKFAGLLQHSNGNVISEEESPYGFKLGIGYPENSVDDIVRRGQEAQTAWQSTSPMERAAVLIEALERASKRFFEIGYATMHTTGQGFVMAFQASGPHAWDRALESIAMAYSLQTSVADRVLWTKPMGKMGVSIDKSYRIMPKGINLVIGCSTFPLWNSTPGIFAGLATGGAVIAKPHPGAVYPLAILIAELQHTLADAGFDPHLVQLAPDTFDNPIALHLVQHPAIRVIDYTGGSAFGNIVEREALSHGKTVFLEKAGVNTAILESTTNLDAALDNLAFALSLYSGQMCTAPQNIFIPKSGVKTDDGIVSADDVVIKLRDKVDALVNNEKVGPGTLGALQNARTADRIDEAKATGASIVRESSRVAHPGFDQSRGMSPLILRTDSSRTEVYENEWFGPISFIVDTESFDQALDLVTNSVRVHGALTTIVYTTDEAKMQKAEDAIIHAGAPVAFNFNSFVWVNQSAAFSDFHGAGNNPAGNASYTDASYITNRYNVLGVRKQA